MLAGGARSSRCGLNRLSHVEDPPLREQCLVVASAIAHRVMLVRFSVQPSCQGWPFMCSSCKSDTSHKPVSGCACHAGAASTPDECECKYGGSFCPSCEH